MYEYERKMLCRCRMGSKFFVKCKVVGNVEFSANVRDNELTLSNTNTIAHPMETHVDGFGAFLLNGVCGDTDRTGGVSH